MKRYMGWGDPHLSSDKKLAYEKRNYDELRTVMPERIGQAHYRGETPAERKVRGHWDFDGWLFTTVEDLVYFGKYRGENGGFSPGPQKLGICVAAADALSLGAKIAHELFVEGDIEGLLGQGDLGQPYWPYVYQTGKVFVGNSSPHRDGSWGTWQQEANCEYGFIPCSTPGLKGPFPQPSAGTCRNFGKSKLNKYKDIGTKYDLVETREITDIDDLDNSLLVEKAPCHISSNWGFRKSHFDDKYKINVYKASGRWSHAMGIVGCVIINDTNWYVTRNQWGRDAHANPGREIPKGCFVISRDTMSSWLKDAYCFNFGKVKTQTMTIPNFGI